MEELEKKNLVRNYLRWQLQMIHLVFWIAILPGKIQM